MNNIAPLERLHLWDVVDGNADFDAAAVEKWYRKHGEDAIGGLRAEMEYDASCGHHIMSFEVVDFDRDVPFAIWRTGTVSVEFDATGTAVGAWWNDHALHRGEMYTMCRLRPLWLSGRFWHLVDEDVKAADSDWTDDPFFGAADFQARRKGQ